MLNDGFDGACVACRVGIKKPATTKVETGSWLALAAFIKRPQAESNRRSA
jgi:hypothetical protein